MCGWVPDERRIRRWVAAVGADQGGSLFKFADNIYPNNLFRALTEDGDAECHAAPVLGRTTGIHFTVSGRVRLSPRAH